MKTLITYYGGKQMLASLIISLIPEHTVYVEPFAGGGAVFFQKEPSKTEIINDIDGMIATFYRVMRDDFKLLKKKVDQTLYDRQTHRFAKAVRDQMHWFNDVQIGWAFVTLSGLGFSGNLESFGNYTNGCKAQTFERKKLKLTPAYAKRLEGVQIENTDAVKLIRLRDSVSSFFYLDPPYILTNQSHYRGYTPEMYKELLDTLTNLKGHFLLSSFPNDVLNEYVLKNDWHVISVNQVKSASRNKDGSKKRKTELLIANYPIKRETDN